MIDKMEIQMEALRASAVSGGEAESGGSNPAYAEEIRKLKSELDVLKKAYEQMEESRDAMKDEMDRRALRGDYNPEETRVLHYRNNPNAQAVGQREEDFKNLQNENEALKARVHLLEEGQTKDLTILVGQKVEEGTSSAEVQGKGLTAFIYILGSTKFKDLNKKILGRAAISSISCIFRIERTASYG